MISDADNAHIVNQRAAFLLMRREDAPAIDAEPDAVISFMQREPSPIVSHAEKPVDPTVLALSARIEQNATVIEAAEEDFYRRRPELRWLQLLTPASDALRRPADEAIARFTTPTPSGTPTIIATCRLDEPWLMTSREDLENALTAISSAIHCDLQISGHSEIDGVRYDECVDWFAQTAAIIGLDPSAPHIGTQMRNRWLAATFTTVPVARGETLILERVCAWCLAKFVSGNEIDSGACVVDEPYVDGFGSLPTD